MPKLIEENSIDIKNGSLSVETLSLFARFHNLLFTQKRNIQNLSILVLVNSIIGIIGFITKVKIANVLGKADFGLLAYGFAIASYAGVIIVFGLNRTFVRDLIHVPKREGQLVISSILLRVFLFLLVILALIIWKFFSPTPSDLTWGVVLVVFGQSMLGLALMEVYDSWGMITRHAIYSLIHRGLYFAAVWFMIILAPKNISVFWIGIFAMAAALFYLWLQYRWVLNRIDFGGTSKSIVNDTLSLARNNLLIWFSCLGCLSFGAINQLILKFYGGRESLGSYAAAWQIALIVILFLGQIVRIGNPATARKTKSGTSKSVRIKFLITYSTVLFLTALPICLAMIVWPEFIIGLIYKPEYASAAGVLRILGIYVMVVSLGVVASQYIISARLEKMYFVIVMLGAALSVTLCFCLIPQMGGVGAAIALLIARGVSMGLYWVILVRHVCSQA